MPRLIHKEPKYRRHASGQAVVKLGGRDYYLGRFDSPESRRKYDSLLGDWLKAGRTMPTKVSTPPPQGDPSELLISELCVYYLKWARTYYRKHGKETRSVERVKLAIRHLIARDGDRPVSQFGPLRLIAIQDRLAESGRSRSYVNDLVRVMQHVFKRGVATERVRADAYQALAAVETLKKGRSLARETAKVAPVSDEIVNKTLQFLPSVVQDIVKFQRKTGCRPGEALSIRPRDVDRSGDVWEYRPESHKTEHHDKERIICIGPEAQTILAPYLNRRASAFCFSPADSERKRKASMRKVRKTKVQPSQVDRRKESPKRKPGDRYTRSSYLWAIRRACNRAFPATKTLKGERLKKWRRDHSWHPNQLRHTAGTEFRKLRGIEASRVALGHSTLAATEVYALADQSLARDIALSLG